MPSKKKDLLKPKPKGKVKTQELLSEIDFLEAADDFEQAAGKWRAGDAAKATRFFNRAIGTYNDGLKRYPGSFDLAYNKANLEYNITQDDRIASQFGNQIALLEETLGSHRFAISLKSTNSDVHFNLAQVLTSLAEAIVDSASVPSSKSEARPLLEEAVQIFTGCIKAQQEEYTQIQTEIAKVEGSVEYREAWQGDEQLLLENEATGQEKEAHSIASETPDDWATVEAMLTPETILETCTAQLGALVTLLSLYDPRTDLSSIEKQAQEGAETANTTIPILIELIERSPPAKVIPEPQSGPILSIGSAHTAEEATTSPQDDAFLAVANFHSSIAEMKFRGSTYTTTQYAQTVEQAFNSVIEKAGRPLPPDLVSANIQSAYADALIDLASALADSPQYSTLLPTFESDIEIQWTALTQAQTMLTALSSAPYTSTLSAARLANILLARGDADLFRFRISSFQTAKPAWIKSKPVLVTNAGVYYRGARSYAEKAGSLELRELANTKAAVAEKMKEVAEGATLTSGSWKVRPVDVEKVMMQMTEEGIIEQSLLSML